jgi:hypothetical protein
MALFPARRPGRCRPPTGALRRRNREGTDLRPENGSPASQCVLESHVHGPIMLGGRYRGYHRAYSRAYPVARHRTKATCSLVRCQRNSSRLSSVPYSCRSQARTVFGDNPRPRARSVGVTTSLLICLMLSSDRYRLVLTARDHPAQSATSPPVLLFWERGGRSSCPAVPPTAGQHRGEHARTARSKSL